MSPMDEGKVWPQLLVVITANFCVLTCGLHIGWPAPSLPKLFSDDYPFEVSEDEGSYITIMGNVGNICGNFLCYFLLDRLGRRKTFLLIAIPQSGSFISFVLSYHVMELLYLGRFLGGMGEGMSITVSYLFVGEITEPRVRGTLCNLVSFSLYFGVLYINVIGSYLSVKITALSCLVFPVVFLVSFWRMPESPYFLLMKNREEETRRALKFLRHKKNVDGEVEALKNDVARQMSETRTLKDILAIDSNRMALLVVIGARFFQVASGTSIFNFYMQILLEEVTDAITPQVGATIILLIQVVMTVVSAFIVDRWGRKPLLLFSSIGCFVDLTIQTTFFVIKEHTEVDLSVVSWLPLVLLMVQIVIYSAGFGAIVSVLQGEMFSASIKSKTSCLVTGSYALITLGFTKYYQATGDGLGLSVPFGTFAILTLVGVGFVYFVVPETKGKTLEEIQQRLKQKGENT